MGISMGAGMGIKYGIGAVVWFLNFVDLKMESGVVVAAGVDEGGVSYRVKMGEKQVVVLDERCVFSNKEVAIAYYRGVFSDRARKW